MNAIQNHKTQGRACSRNVASRDQSKIRNTGERKASGAAFKRHRAQSELQADRKIGSAKASGKHGQAGNGEILRHRRYRLGVLLLINGLLASSGLTRNQ